MSQPQINVEALRELRETLYVLYCEKANDREHCISGEQNHELDETISFILAAIRFHAVTDGAISRTEAPWHQDPNVLSEGTLNKVARAGAGLRAAMKAAQAGNPPITGDTDHKCPTCEQEKGKGWLCCRGCGKSFYDDGDVDNAALK